MTGEYHGLGSMDGVGALIVVDMVHFLWDGRTPPFNNGRRYHALPAPEDLPNHPKENLGQS
jgi:hypothetical protein